MLLLRVLPFLTLLLGARASSLDSRGPSPHRLDVRDTPDVCASVDAGLLVPLLTAPGFLISCGLIDQCLCLSDIPNFLKTNDVGIQGVNIGGPAKVTSILTGLINSAAAKSKCVYPASSAPVCVNGIPCGFQCTDGFTPSPAVNPTTCICSAPMVICNGQCVAAGACPSSQPVLPVTLKKRTWVGSGSCTEMGPGWAACGVFGAGPRAWECINTARDLESCGGCAFPLTAYSPIGEDCSTLPGVADVSCLGGECVVHRCLPGYMPAIDGTRCIRKHHISQSQFSDPEDVPARVYGLEHVPLGRN